MGRRVRSTDLQDDLATLLNQCLSLADLNGFSMTAARIACAIDQHEMDCRLAGIKQHAAPHKPAERARGAGQGNQRARDGKDARGGPSRGR